MNKGGKLLYGFVFSLTGIAMLYCFVLTIFFRDRLPFYLIHFFALPNYALFILGCVLISIIYVLARKAAIFSKIINTSEKIRIIEWSVFALFFIFQLILTYCTYAYPLWDVGTMMDYTLLINDGVAVDPWYFSNYPNNILLLNYMLLLNKLSRLLPFNIFKDGVYIYLVVNCIINSFTGVIIYKFIKRYKGIRIAALGWIIYAILVGSSGWLDICYSDSLVLFIPVTVVYLYTKYDKFVINVLIGIMAIIGTYVKPQCIIIIIAIIISLSIKLVCGTKELRIAALKRIVSILLGMLVGFILSIALRYNNKIELNKEDAFGVAHYIMMGLQDSGEYSYDDWEFSRSFSTKKERTSANLEVAKQRVKDMKIIDLHNHFVKKTLYSYADGSYAFENINSTAFWKEDRSIDNKIAHILTNIIRGGGISYFVMDGVRQANWLVILFITSIVPFVNLKRNKADNEHIFVLGLSILGLFLFIMLFESKARYLYAYIPVYIVMAILGLPSFKKNTTETDNP